jgi:hypothetical protein
VTIIAAQTAQEQSRSASAKLQPALAQHQLPAPGATGQLALQLVAAAPKVELMAAGPMRRARATRRAAHSAVLLARPTTAIAHGGEFILPNQVA